MNLEQWNSNNLVSTEELDHEISKLKELEEDAEKKKKIYSEAYDKSENQRTLVLELLKKAGKTKYHVSGIGTVSMAITTRVSLPKEPLERKAMVDYFLGLEDNLYAAYLTVNSQTLNSYINQQTEIEKDFTLPGVGKKKETPELRFKKDAK